MYETLFEVYSEDEFDREEAWQVIYRTVNDAYNHMIVRYKKYVRSVNSFDFFEIYNHPVIAEIRSKMRPNPGSIDRAYKKATTFFMTDESLKHNPVLSEAKNGISKMEQLLQVAICRGYNTDIDDHIYNYPIMGNYFAGIHDPAEALMDSTLASKAYIYQGAPLEKTQYGNRKLQISSARVDLMINGDCGSQKYADIEVTKNRAKGLLGMFFVHPETGKLTAFKKKTQDEWIGKTLKFRVPIYCGYRDKSCVCTTCYGELSRNLPYGVNIGITASVNTQSEVSQRVLKVKHVESLTNHEPLVLSPAERDFIVNHEESNHLNLSPKIKGKPIRLLIRSEAKDKIINGSRLPVLSKEELHPDKTTALHSQFRDLIFEIALGNGKIDRRRGNVSKGSMSSFLTYDFLMWFLDQDIGIDEDGFYRINLESWDFSKPFLELPKKQMSMKDFSSEVEVFIRSTQDNSSKHLGKLKQLNQYHDAAQAMLDLYDLISHRVGVHLSHVGVVCLSMMVSANDRFSSKIPPLNHPAVFAKYSRILSQGSFSALASYQGGQSELMKLEQYLNTDREPHLFDPFWLPSND